MSLRTSNGSPPFSGLIRRFDQFIRQAGHFGNRLSRVNDIHRFSKQFIDPEKQSFRTSSSLRVKLWRRKMADFDYELRSRKPVILFFAFVSTISTAAAAITPFVVYA
jgi:hypothetical protein